MQDELYLSRNSKAMMIEFERWNYHIQSNLVNTTLVYMTPSILGHFLVQNSLFFIQVRHLIMRHLESPFCHIKEVVNAKIPFIYVVYI